MKRRRIEARGARVPIGGLREPKQICLEVEDHSNARWSAVRFFDLQGKRDPQAEAARLAQQFEIQNRELLSLLDVQIGRDYDGSEVSLRIQAGSQVGAIPLISPTTARPDYGLVVQPRFPWRGIGPMLAEMGWRITPVPLRLPLLHRSERRVPIWVLSYMILVRLSALLDSLDRRFELISERRRAPRGRINWPEYAIKSLPRANFLSVPCTFSDLRDDRLLQGAIRYTADRQLRALETQKEHGAFVHRLIEFAERILRRGQHVPQCIPSSTAVNNWLTRPLRSNQFLEGIQAIEWTVDERGLAGLSDLEGIPWRMPMDQFFEAWVETALRSVAQKTGAQVKIGRKHQTMHPIAWTPPYWGSQKSLAPDLWLEWSSVTMIVDAKYKRHWEELQEQRWSTMQQEVREQHRNDLLQVLAYANLARTQAVIACLAYPCSAETWKSLRERGRLFHRADVTIGPRSVNLWLTAFPMSMNIEQIAAPMTEQLRNVFTTGGLR